MTTFHKPIAFIATVDPVESRKFYEHALGLECLSDEPYALVFDLGGVALRIQKVEAIPKTSHTVLGWEVLDIHACVEELSKKGIRFERFSQLGQDDVGIWSSPGGALVAWFRDPDGNTLSLTQHSS